MNELREFKDRLAHARSQKGLTQEALGKKLGLKSPEQVNRWENTGKIPRGPTVARIARILGVSTEWLLLGTAGAVERAAEAELHAELRRDPLTAEVTRAAQVYRARAAQGAGEDELRWLRKTVVEGLLVVAARDPDQSVLAEAFADMLLDRPAGETAAQKTGEEGGVARR